MEIQLPNKSGIHKWGVYRFQMVWLFIWLLSFEHQAQWLDIQAASNLDFECIKIHRTDLCPVSEWCPTNNLTFELKKSDMIWISGIQYSTVYLGGNYPSSPHAWRHLWMIPFHFYLLTWEGYCSNQKISSLIYITLLEQLQTKLSFKIIWK